MVTRLNQKRKFSLKDALRRNDKNDIVVKWQKPKKASTLERKRMEEHRR